MSKYTESIKSLDEAIVIAERGWTSVLPEELKEMKGTLLMLQRLEKKDTEEAISAIIQDAEDGTL